MVAPSCCFFPQLISNTSYTQRLTSSAQRKLSTFSIAFRLDVRPPKPLSSTKRRRNALATPYEDLFLLFATPPFDSALNSVQVVSSLCVSRDDWQLFHKIIHAKRCLSFLGFFPPPSNQTRVPAWLQFKVSTHFCSSFFHCGSLRAFNRCISTTFLLLLFSSSAR